VTQLFLSGSTRKTKPLSKPINSLIFSNDYKTPAYPSWPKQDDRVEVTSLTWPRRAQVSPRALLSRDISNLSLDQAKAQQAMTRTSWEARHLPKQPRTLAIFLESVKHLTRDVLD